MSTLTLTQRRAIDRAKEGLVLAAESLLTEAGVIRISKNQFGHSQLRNLIAVATETESPAVVANFIRYQMGRAGKDEGWSDTAGVGAGGKKLGERFIEEIDDQGEGAVAQALRKVPNLGDDPLAKQLARIELIRQFLGFTSRYLKFLDLQRNGGRKPSNGAEDDEGESQ